MNEIDFNSQIKNKPNTYPPTLPDQAGNEGKVLTTDGSTISWQTAGGGSGDVAGPSFSVDSNFSAFDGASGKSIKDSGYNAASFAPATPSGVVQMYAGASAPAGWLVCDGSAISRALFSDLFTAIGTTYGVGDGATTFNIPDMRGRVPVGVGAGTGGGASGTGKPAGGSALTNRTLAAWFGVEAHQLTVTEMPSHSHAQNAHTHIQNSHNHTQNPHTHTQAAHNHTQDAHNHGQIAHNHTQDMHWHGNEAHTHSQVAHSHGNDAHTHSQNAHNHSQNAHNHFMWESRKYVTGLTSSGGTGSAPSSSGFSFDLYTGTSTATNNAETATNNANTIGIHSAQPGIYENTIAIHAATATNQATTAGNTATTAANQATTATNDNATAANNAATAANQNTTATNQSTGGGTTHTNVQPAMTLNFIIKT